MEKLPVHDELHKDGLKKRLECELPKLQKISVWYRFWWNLQVMTLLLFLGCLVLSVAESWWFLFPSCVFLGASLFANSKRMELSRRYEGIEEAITGRERLEE